MLNRGQTYYLQYYKYHHDPYPYLWITGYDGRYTQGFNLHYLPNIRFNIPIEKYRYTNQALWEKSFNNMVEAGFFGGFLDVLQEASDINLSDYRVKKLVQYISKRYPSAMKCYRKYLTAHISRRYIIKI